MAKQIPDLVIDKLGTHLLRCTYKDGRQSFKWDWEVLEHEVKAAMLAFESKQELAAVKTKPAAKKDLVKETETKVSKARAKKAVNDQITDAVTTKKPAAKKAAAKKK